MYEDGQLENELKVLKKVTKAMTRLNVELSKIKVDRMHFVIGYSDLVRELERRQAMMTEYKATGQF